MRAHFNHWLLNKLSGTLEFELQEAILGDLEELKISEGRAARELFGLLLRRQAKLWTNWRPWLALLGIAWPISWLLTNFSSAVASSLNIQALAYWKYGVSYSTGLTDPQEILTLVCQALAIIFWSWTGGYVLGSLSNRTVWMNRILLCLVCFFHGKLIYFAWLYLQATLPFKHFGTVKFPFYFYCAIYPTVLLLFLLLPAFAGIRLSQRRRQFEIKPAILLTAAIASLTTLVTLTEGWQFTAVERWSMGALHYATPRWEERLLPLLMLSWPAAYLLMVSMKSYRSKVTAS